MAANKFATMLHKNTNKITLILVYALLEWVLIALLLLNSLFSYLIIKYADYFGLKRPCVWCARLDHIFEPSKYKNSCRDLVCDDHANEISKLGYCSNHKKLAESQDMCEDCLSSSRSDCCDLSKKLAFFPWMKQVGLIQDGCEKVMENGEENLKCSCCGVLLERKLKFPYLLITPSWEVLEYPQKGNLIAEAEGVDGGADKANASFGIRSDIEPDCQEDEQKNEENNILEIMSDGDEEDAKGREVGKEEEEFSCFISSFDCNQRATKENDKDHLINEKDQVPMEKQQEGEGEGNLYVSLDGPELTQVGCCKQESPGEEEEEEDDEEGLINVPMDGSELTEAACGNEKSPGEEEFLKVSMDGSELTQAACGNEKSPEEEEFLNVSMDGSELTQAACSKEKSPVDEEEEGDVNVSMDGPELTQVGCSKEKSPVNDEEEGDVNVSMDGPELIQVGCSKQKFPEILSKHFEFYIEGDDCHLIPIELMGSTAVESRRTYKFSEEDQGLSDNGDVILDFDLHPETPTMELVVENKCRSGKKMALYTVHEEEDENDLAEAETMESNEKEESFLKYAEEEDTTQATQTPLNEADDVQGAAAETGEGERDIDINQVSEAQNDEIEADISIGTDIPDHEPMEDIQMQHLYECIPEDLSTSSDKLHANDDYGSKDAEEETIQFKTMTVETCDQAVKNHLLSSELNEIEEDKVPDTPTSIDSLHLLHKKLLLLDRKESGTEDSLDGSVFSDIESADGVLTVDKLKSALKAERKALNALYTELEEERSASAVAANQTMAMINRLQEEKAAMQMEALQYQRMMEEQSEYDQEALQLLNELMVKREKEKAELEKELEVYRRKVQDYETREKVIMLRRRKDDSTRSATSASCSNAEDSDGLSVDLNHEPKEEDGFNNHQEDSNQNTPAEAVLYLEESLANFEEERLSILEQLKVLEEKLVSLNDEEEQDFGDITSVEYLHEENGNGFHDYSDFSNGVSNGHFKGVNGKHHQDQKPIAPKAKSLLPLFDATDAEMEDGTLNGHENGFDSVALLHPSPANSEVESKRLAIEEEVDYVYERLQALEADREFLKHCISSLKKGDKGVYLLQEILQHLRDLRSVELRARSIGEAAV